MLQKTKSKKVWQLKYLLLLPMVFAMLFYTSCQLEESIAESDKQAIIVADIDQLTLEEEIQITTTLKELVKSNQEWELYVKDQKIEVKFVNTTDDSYISGLNGEQINAKMIINSTVDITIADIFGNNDVYDGVSFAKVDEVPIFPGCENDIDLRACFNKMIQKHIGENFRYPEEAQKLGIQGRVSVMFVIAKDGSIQGIRKRGSNKLLEDEADRIIGELPKMEPGKYEGKAVNVPFSIPINFKLEQGGFNNFSDVKTIDSKDYTNNLDVPFTVIDEVPLFPGCEDASDKRACFSEMIQKHIGKNFNYPQEAQEKGIQGRVSIMFNINKEGNIDNVRMRGPDKLLEDEAERIIKKLPKMKPGKHQGKKVNVPFSIPVNFKLQ